MLQEPAFQPVDLLDIELTSPLANLPPWPGPRQALIRYRSRPIGFLDLPPAPEELPACQIAETLWANLGAEIVAERRRCQHPIVMELTRDGLELPLNDSNAPPSSGKLAPHISIIVATHNRTASLLRCLASLQALDYPAFEIIVVDNAPTTDDTARALRRLGDPRVRYVREAEPGLAIAHNRGLQEVRSPIVAFTDDDVEVDSYWLRAIAEAFALDPNIGCVTGMILPAELDTQAQLWLEQFGGFGKGLGRQRFDLNEHRPADVLFPYAAGRFGSGANMAFRSEALRAIGGFEPTLGAGSRGVGGDDLAAFFEIIMAGYTLVYEPAALLRHYHRRDYASLQRTAYGYGVGLTAYLAYCVASQPRRLFDIAWRLPRAFRHITHSASPKNSRKGANYPTELNRMERRGMLAGPLAYWRSRRHLARRREMFRV